MIAAVYWAFTICQMLNLPAVWNFTCLSLHLVHTTTLRSGIIFILQLRWLRLRGKWGLLVAQISTWIWWAWGILWKLVDLVWLLLLPQWNLSKVFLVLTFLRQLIGPMAEEEFLLNSIISPEDWRITRGLEDWRHSFLTFWVGLYSDQVPLSYIANPSAVILAQFQILVTSISSFTLFHQRQIKLKRETWLFYKPAVTWHFLSPIQVCPPMLTPRHQASPPSCSLFSPCTQHHSLILPIFKVRGDPLSFSSSALAMLSFLPSPFHD